MCDQNSEEMQTLRDRYCEIKVMMIFMTTSIYSASCKDCENDVIIIHDSSHKPFCNALKMSSYKIKELCLKNILVEAHEVTTIGSSIDAVYPAVETLMQFRNRNAMSINSIRNIILKVMSKLLILSASQLAFLKLESYNIVIDRNQNVKLIGLKNMINVEPTYSVLCSKPIKYQNNHPECEWYPFNNMCQNIGRLAYFLYSGQIPNDETHKIKQTLNVIDNKELREFILDLIHPGPEQMDFFEIIIHPFVTKVM